MPFQLSPGVLVTEQDLTTIVPAVATTPGGFVGSFEWGPIEEVMVIDSENTLVSKVGAPNANTASSFYTAANFLAYGNQLLTIRASGPNARNAIANANVAAAVSPDLVKNSSLYETVIAPVNSLVSAKYAGQLGNSLRVSMADANTWSSWAYASEFDRAPSTSSFVSALGGSNDELHVVILDRTGLISGTANTVIEKFGFVSKCADVTSFDGTSTYYRNVLNNSKYLWWRGHPIQFGSGAGNNWGTAGTTAFSVLTSNVTIDLFGGANDLATDGNIISAYDILGNDEAYDVSLLPMGASNSAVITYVISNLAERRKDCMVFFSPPLSSVQANVTQPVTSIISFRNNTMANISSSYAVMDSGWKYQYDRYNDVYRWVPLNGDVAGLCARTDLTNDPWWSPAGLNRGQIKNVVKLAYSPNKTDRDLLYKNGVNPVISVIGSGTVLYGDKTLQIKPSAFDRINVRRLFIVLEKAIATASKYSLFEFNDAFTRAQFKNLVEPYLRDVQGRRGITDFLVVCDTTNNTGEVIDRNEFVADIYIKPARSINFITLNFIATRTGISFSEVGA